MVEEQSYKVFVICRKDFFGADTASRNLSNSFPAIKHFSIGSCDIDNPEIRLLCNYLNRQDKKIIILSGSVGVYADIINKLKGKNTIFGVYWFSSAGQAEISKELKILVSLLGSPVIKYKFFASEELYVGLKKYSSDIYYLPVIMADFSCVSIKKNLKNKRNIIFSLFCSQSEYKRKNVLNVLLALSNLKRQYVLYLNGLSREDYYKSFLNRLHIVYEDFGFMDRAKYEKVLSQVDIGLQASFAESFNYVAAEHLIRGIPVIASNMVPVMNVLPYNVRKMLVVNSIDDPIAISKKIEELIASTKSNLVTGSNISRYIVAENKKRRVLVGNLLESIARNRVR